MCQVDTREDISPRPLPNCSQSTRATPLVESRMAVPSLQSSRIAPRSGVAGDHQQTGKKPHLSLASMSLSTSSVSSRPHPKSPNKIPCGMAWCCANLASIPTGRDGTNSRCKRPGPQIRWRRWEKQVGRWSTLGRSSGHERRVV